MKRILVLGGFGFIATNILKFIDAHYSDRYEAIVFDRIPKHPHGVTFKCVKKVYAGDFSDETNIERIFKENQIDFVIHLLSSTVPATSNNARYEVESNLIPTLKLLETMDRYSVRDIVYISSGGAVYGDTTQKPHNEEDAAYPKSAYGVVKLSIEKFMLSFAELHGFHTLILRLSNPYGRYHYNDRQGIINIAVRKALKGEQLQIWGSGNGIKDYIYIDDVCDILLRLVADGISTAVYNIGSGNAMSVNEITDAITRLLPTFKTIHIEAATNDVQSFQLDITKLRTTLGAYTMTTFDEALKSTVDWQKNNL